MSKRAMWAQAVGVGIFAALVASGCSTGTEGEPAAGDGTAGGATEQTDAGSAAFVACLGAAGVEAKVNASGQVALKWELDIQPGAPGQGSASAGSQDLGEYLSMEGDETGTSWIAYEDSTFLDAAPDIQDAYAGCEGDFPDFTQPAYSPPENPDADAQAQAAEESALAFASCARENGFASIGDPDPAIGGGILLPTEITEDEFRALLSACWTPESNVAFGAMGDLSFDWVAVWDEFQVPVASGS